MSRAARGLRPADGCEVLASREGQYSTGAAAWRCVVLEVALRRRRLRKPTLHLVDRYDREHQQHSKHNHWNTDDV
jgi:hypothetical protein